MEIDMGFERGQGARPKSTSAKISSWYVHYYVYPILNMLEEFNDFICLEQKASFDLLWISELDPSGLDDDLSAILHPEGGIFNNLIAQSSCSEDCRSASWGKVRAACFR
jgi:conjugal transfer pilus assembly protein TraU